MVRTFHTNLHVDTKIVGLLSKSTYQKSFASAIRELVSNAYDADALVVKVHVNEDYDNIEIWDDGNGMTQKEFEKYLTIAGSKSKTNLTRKYKRTRIGQFGIGFLSIFPFCEALEITTTTENSNEILSTTIPASKYMESKEDIDVKDIPIEGKISQNKPDSKLHWTRIRLINTSYLVKQYFAEIDTKKRDSIIAYKAFEKFKWELQEDLPISYHPKLKSIEVIKYKEPIGINVYLNGGMLYRNEFPNIILERDSQLIQGIECEFVFATNYESIKPMESRGVKIRVNNVGVGIRTDFELKRDRGFSRLHWINGEIYIDNQAKELLNISRDTFITSPIMDEITNVFAEKLKKWAYYVEDVSLAEKSIDESFKTTKRQKVEPKKERIERGVESLVKKGFTVVSDTSQTVDSPIKVDKVEKKIYVNEEAKEAQEYEMIRVVGEDFRLEYSTDFNNENIPCRIINNTIIVNSKYPLYKSKTFGTVFKKMHILFHLAKNNSNNKDEFYSYFLENFLDEFNDYLK